MFVQNVRFPDVEDAVKTPFMETKSKEMIRSAWNGKVEDYAERLSIYRWFGTRDYTMALIIFSLIVLASKYKEGKEILKKGTTQSLSQICEYIGGGKGKNLKTYLETNQAQWYKEIFNDVLGHCKGVDDKQKETVWNNFLNQVKKMKAWVINKKYVETELCDVVQAAFGESIAKKTRDSLKSGGEDQGSSKEGVPPVVSSPQPRPKPEPKPGPSSSGAYVTASSSSGSTPKFQLSSPQESESETAKPPASDGSSLQPQLQPKPQPKPEPKPDQSIKFIAPKELLEGKNLKLWKKLFLEETHYKVVNGANTYALPDVRRFINKGGIRDSLTDEERKTLISIFEKKELNSDISNWEEAVLDDIVISHCVSIDIDDYSSILNGFAHEIEKYFDKKAKEEEASKSELKFIVPKELKNDLDLWERVCSATPYSKIYEGKRYIDCLNYGGNEYLVPSWLDAHGRGTMVGKLAKKCNDEELNKLFDALTAHREDTDLSNWVEVDKLPTKGFNSGQRTLTLKSFIFGLRKYVKELALHLKKKPPEDIVEFLVPKELENNLSLWIPLFGKNDKVGCKTEYFDGVVPYLRSTLEDGKTIVNKFDNNNYGYSVDQLRKLYKVFSAHRKDTNWDNWVLIKQRDKQELQSIGYDEKGTFKREDYIKQIGESADNIWRYLQSGEGSRTAKPNYKIENLSADEITEFDTTIVDDPYIIEKYESYVPEPVSDADLEKYKTSPVNVDEKLAPEEILIDEALQTKVLETYYDKTLGEEKDPPFVVIVGGKKREWVPINGFRKAGNLTPLSLYEKLQLMLEGAQGGDLGTVRGTLAKYGGGSYEPKSCIAFYKRAGEQEKQSFLEAVSRLETDKIFHGRPVSGYKMGDDSHGINHAKRLVGYINDIAKYIRTYSETLKLKSPTNEDILLAKYAALFHDCGRANDMVDVFGEVSAEIAAKELIGKLSGSQIIRVRNAIKNKDANVKGKDIVAIMLHEADCLDVQRVKDKYEFDIQYLDVFQLFCYARSGEEFSGEICDDAQKLVDMAKEVIDSDG